MRNEGHPVRGFLQLGFMLVACGAVSALYQPRPSAEFVLSVCSAAMGVFITVGSLILVRLMRPGE